MYLVLSITLSAYQPTAQGSVSAQIETAVFRKTRSLCWVEVSLFVANASESSLFPKTLDRVWRGEHWFVQHEGHTQYPCHRQFFEVS